MVTAWRTVVTAAAAATGRVMSGVTAAAAGSGVGEAVHHLRGRRWRVEAVGASGSVPTRGRGVVPAHRGVGNGVAAARRTGRRRHHEHVLKQEKN